MELRHLRYFVRVAELEHFGRAATKLNVSQPALSQQIAELEREIGVALFERRPRGVLLSDAGRLMLTRAREILAAVDTAVEDTRDVGLGRKGRLLVGLPEGNRALAVIRRAVERFRSERPDVELVTTGLPWSEQPREVLDGRLDVAFCWQVADMTAADDGRDQASAPHAVGLAWHALFADPGCYVLVEQASPLATQESVSMSDLHGRPLAIVSRELLPVLFDRITAAVRAAGGPAPSVTDGVRTAAALTPLLTTNDGWALIPESLRTAAPPGTVARPLADFSIPGSLDVLWREGDERVTVHAFVQLVREVSEEERAS